MSIRILSLALEAGEAVTITWDAKSSVNLWILSATKEDRKVAGRPRSSPQRFSLKKSLFGTNRSSTTGGDDQIDGRPVLRSLGMIKERHCVWRVDLPVGTAVVVACAGKGTSGLVQRSETYVVKESPRLNYPSLQLLPIDSHLVKLPDLTKPYSGGSFSDIFIGTFKPTGLALVLKRPRSAAHEQLSDAKIKERLRREGTIWSTFSHLNILPYYGLLEVQSDVYLVSPMMPLGSLCKFSSDRSTYLSLPDDERARDPKRASYERFNEYSVVAGIACGLTYLHSMRITHGDLKAANVLLDDDINPVLCDFGLTKITDGIAITSAGLRGAGTAAWMSPEILEGNSKTSESDVYALGMTIGEVMTGVTPYSGKLPHAVINIVTNGRGDPPFASHPSQFDDLWQVLLCCIAYSPDDRPTAATICNLFDGTRIVEERLANTCRPPPERQRVSTSVDRQRAEARRIGQSPRPRAASQPQGRGTRQETMATLTRAAMMLPPPIEAAAGGKALGWFARLNFRLGGSRVSQDSGSPWPDKRRAVAAA